MIRKDWNDQIYRTEKEKDDAIVKLVSEKYHIGQPILIFTSSINKSEHYSELLNKKKNKSYCFKCKKPRQRSRNYC